MKRYAAALLFVAGFLFLSAWTFDDCVDVEFDHPDCDQYATTTTGVPPSTTSTTSPKSTTSTSGPDQSTTTSTTTELPTTTVTPDTTTTTTVAQCPPGMIHQPPLCVPPTTDTTSDIRVSSTEVTRPPELPETGSFDVAMVLLAIASLFFLGLVALKGGEE